MTIVINNTDFDKSTSLEDTFALAGLQNEEYHDALGICKTGYKIILRRSVKEISVNYYNPEILKTWQANMDLQYIVDPYSCVMYVASYVLKSEKAMSETLKSAAKESERESIKEQLKKVGTQFLNHREVSAQEAAYRLLSMPLKKSSRSVIYINTNTRDKRVGLLKSSQLLENLKADDENIFETSLLDRYMARPDSLTDLCLAEFAAWFIPCQSNKKSSSEQSMLDSRKGIITLKEGLGKMRKKRIPSVIRFFLGKNDKDQDSKFRRKLMLYLPWRSENTDLLKHHLSHQAHYESVAVDIFENEAKFTKNADQVEMAVELLGKQGPPEHVWDGLAPSTESTEAAHVAEGPVELRHIDTEDKPSGGIATHIYEKFTTEANKAKLTPTQYRDYFYGLNEQQKLAVQYHREWCQRSTHALKVKQPVEPYYIFLNGPGGVGKSHVIKMIQHDTIRFFSESGKYNPEDIPVILTGPTGTSAFAINGITIHSAFRLNISSSHQYLSLSRDLLNTLHGKLGKLQLVIIDEVSMVGNRMIYHVHRRLEEIIGKQIENSYFGGISILAVGDLYQLRPVLQGHIFEDLTLDCSGLCESVWKENFKLCELTQQMRQRETLFVETLNRIRIGEFTQIDIDLLQTHIVKVDDRRYVEENLQSELHVFSTNKAVNMHNEKMLQMFKQQGIKIHTVHAIDSTRDQQTHLVDVKLPENHSETGGLREKLLLAVGAKVMLTSNINVSDGLVNGACGFLAGIMCCPFGEVHTLLVKFDNENVGLAAIATSPYKTQYSTAVPLVPISVTFKIGKRKALEVSRKQFPITLAWSLTIHKVQGLTVDKIVVSMAGRFGPGQAYVAFSRVKSVAGLFILDFDSSKIKADECVKNEMQRLYQNPLIGVQKSIIYSYPSRQYFRLAHLNVSGYLQKMKYIEKANWKKFEVLCFSETWLGKSHALSGHSHSDHVIVRKDRCAVPGLENIGHGGVLLLSAQPCKEITFDLPYFEAIAVNVQTTSDFDLNILTIYRRPGGIPLQQFLSIMERAMNLLPKAPTIVLGDFNSDILFQNSPVNAFMIRQGYRQHVIGPTSDHGTCIDHVYSRNVTMSVQVETEDTYFSDHRTILVAIEL